MVKYYNTLPVTGTKRTRKKKMMQKKISHKKKKYEETAYRILFVEQAIKAMLTKKK